jgi:hypothetical protein
VKDFSRLDERFRLPVDTWNQLPAHHDYGFAVFKLKPGVATVHPMAFSFPRRDQKTLFFHTHALLSATRIRALATQRLAGIPRQCQEVHEGGQGQGVDCTRTTLLSETDARAVAQSRYVR